MKVVGIREIYAAVNLPSEQKCMVPSFIMSAIVTNFSLIIAKQIE